MALKEATTIVQRADCAFSNAASEEHEHSGVLKAAIAKAKHSSVEGMGPQQAEGAALLLQGGASLAQQQHQKLCSAVEANAQTAKTLATQARLYHNAPCQL